MKECAVQTDDGLFSADKKKLIRVSEKFSNSKFKEEFTRYEVPSGVVYIENKAFKDCGNLEEIIIPEGVTHIGDDCFLNCRNLKKIQLPDSLESIGMNAFSFCKSLTSIVIPKNVTVIPGLCFKQCKSLKEVLLPQGINSIEDFAFTACKSLEIVAFYPEPPEHEIAVANHAFLFSSYGKTKRNFFVNFILNLIYYPVNWIGCIAVIFGIVNIADVILRYCTDSYRMKYNADMSFFEAFLCFIIGFVLMVIAGLWKRFWKI